jgi:WD40 repeat protein
MSLDSSFPVAAPALVLLLLLCKNRSTTIHSAGIDMNTRSACFLLLLSSLLLSLAVVPAGAQLRVVAPNGQERLVADSMALVQWAGVDAAAVVRLEYSTDNGTTWSTITSTATGLQHQWQLPHTISDRCLLRVSTADTVFNDSVLYTGEGRTLDQYSGMHWSPDGGFLGIGYAQQILDVRDLSVHYEFTTAKTSTLSFSPDGNYALFLHNGAWLVNISKKQVVRHYPWNLTQNVWWSPVDGRFLGAGDGFFVFDTASTTPLDTLQEVAWTYGQPAQWSPLGKQILGSIGGGSDTYRYARIWDSYTGDSIYRFDADDDRIYNLGYNPQGTHLFISGSDSIIKVWDARNGEFVSRIVAPPMMVGTIEWSPDGTMLLVGLRNDSAVIYDIATGQRLRTLHTTGTRPHATAWSKDGRWIVVVPENGWWHIFEASTGRLTQLIPPDPPRILQPAADHNLQFSPDGSKLAVMDGSGRVAIMYIDPKPGDSDVSDQTWSIVEEGSLSVGDIDSQRAMKVSPNPASTTLDIEIDPVEQKGGRLLLIDMNGREVKSFAIGDMKPARRSLRLDVSAVASGSYYLILRTPATTRATRIEVQR